MRITIVQGPFLPIPPLKGGAIEKFFYALAPLWVAEGHEVTYISRSFQDLPQRETVNGILHLRVPSRDSGKNPLLNKYRDFLYAEAAAKVAPAADILISNTFFFPLLAKPHQGALWIHAGRFPRGQLSLYSKAAVIQFPAHSIRQSALDQAPHLREKFCVLPYALPNFPPHISPKTQLSENPKLLFVGRLHPEKGVHLLLKALGLLPEALAKKLTLTLVGPDASDMGGGGEHYLKELHSLAQKSPAKVIFAGAVFNPDALAAHYASADLFIYPSLADKGETFGVAPLEALSHGVPVLLSSLPCFGDFLKAGQNGFVFDHHSAEPAQSLAMALSEALQAPHDWSRLSACARASSEGFTLPKVSAMFLNKFKELLAQKS